MTRKLPKTLTFLVGIAFLCGVVPSALHAQEEREHGDHDHEGLHFSHPLLNESPSPDTKLRLDLTWARG